MLDPDLRAPRQAYARPYDRRAEAIDLLELVADRGSSADGALWIEVLEQEWPNHDGATAMCALRDRVAACIAQPGCPAAIRSAVVARLRAGEQLVADASDLTLVHDEPTLAGRLLRVIAGFGDPRYDALLAGYCRSGQPNVAGPAGLAFARHARSRSRRRNAARAIAASVANGPPLEVGADDARRDLRQLVAAFGILAPQLADAEQDRAVDAALARLGNDPWLIAAESLVPFLGERRRVRTIPVLIDALRRARDLGLEPRYPTSLPYRIHSIHEALQDLTGYAAPADDPDRWQQFWLEVREDFALPPRKPTAETNPTASFYGIPIRGRRVLFVVDRSGSMAQPHRSRGEEFVTSRLACAKAELLAAIGRLPKTATFQVLWFGDSVQSMRQRRVSTRGLAALKKSLHQIQATGGTNLLAALEAGMAKQVRPMTSRGRPSVDEIFVLSDGSPSKPPELILQTVAAWNPGRAARVHAIFIGPRPAADVVDRRDLSSPPVFMQRLAAENGGVFRHIAN